MSNKLPSVTSDIPRDLRNFIDRLREVISSSGTDRFVTAQDLINGGLADAGTNGTLVPIKKGVIATPPAPQNLTVTGSVNSIFVEWDNPTYFGHDYTEVYSGGTDVLGDAVLLGFTPGVNYVDTIGPQQSRYYWARFINTEGTAGPFNSINGTLGQTGVEVEHMLDVLTGSITASQLYQDLGDRINLIDGPTSLAGSVAAQIYAEAQARLAADTTLGSSITTLQNVNSTQASQITTLQTRASTSESNIISLQSTTATQATTISSLTTRTSTAESNITNLQTTTANQASSITTLSSSVGANTTAIQTEATTRASETGSLFSKYTVKIDTNGYVSGFGLASTANNATPFSDFIIRADRFSIAAPSGPGVTPLVPFIVTTTSQIIDGTTVPAGVYIDGAYIKGGTIKGSAIEAGTITGTKLIDVSANKITGAALAATSYIESAAYIAGTQGWKIHANGTAEFAAASIRGQLTASQINANGLSIRDTSGTIILNAGTGAFTGNVTGTVSGTAASTVVSNASTALSTANTASTNASTALSTANTANTNANTAISGLANKLNSDARNILAGSGGLATGTLNWNSSGVRTSGSGVGLTANGLVAYNSSGVATFALNGSTGAASFAGDITAGTVGGSSVGSTYVRSANYASGSSGWNISSNGNAEFNQITVRSGQIIGALGVAYKIQSTLSLYVEISGGTGISTTNGPYYLNGGSPPQYLVYSNYMPANATAPHKIAISVNVQSTGGGATKDLAVLVLVNSSISGSTIYADEQIAYNTNSGPYGVATNATGVSTNTYSTAIPVMIFVGGYNAAYTIQTVDGIAWGVR